MIENGNMNSNQLNSRGLHMNEKGVLQFAENLIEGTVSYYVRKKKVSMESDDQNSRISPNNF